MSEAQWHSQRCSASQQLSPGSSRSWRNCEPQLSGLKTLEGMEATLCGSPCCWHCWLSLCTEVSGFLFGLFLQGFVRSLPLCTFHQPLSAGLWLETAAVLLWLLEQWDFHCCLHGVTRERWCLNVTLAWTRVDIHVLELTCPFGFLTFLRLLPRGYLRCWGVHNN